MANPDARQNGARPRVTLRPAAPDDAPLLRHWAAQPHVRAGVGDDEWIWEEELSRSPDWRELLVAEVGARPIGFMQIIDPQREDSHYWGDCGPHLRAVDIWIGEADCLSHGYGTEMMRQAIERCFSPADVTAVLVDPLAGNTGARRFYERLGFVHEADRIFGEDLCAVYRLERHEAP